VASTFHYSHGVVLHCTCATLRLCIGPARETGLSTGTWRGHVQPCKRRKERRMV